MWRITRQHPDSPPFSGGVLDAWPHRVSQGFAIANAEVRIITHFLEARRAGERPEVTGG